MRKNALPAFSLVEVMVAMTLLGIVFAGAFAALQMGYSMTGEARDRTRASQILQTELEAMRTMNWSDLSEMVGQQDEFFEPRGEFVAAFKDRFFCKRTVTMRTNNNQMEVTLTITWGAYPHLKEETFTTIFTRNGINDYYYRTL